MTSTIAQRLVALALLAPAGAAAQTALVLGDDPLALDAVEATLLAVGPWQDADVDLLPGSATPTAGDLAGVDVALLVGGTWDDPDALGDVLTTFVDGGGSVVIGGFAATAGALPGGTFPGSYGPVAASAPGSAAGALDPAQSVAHPATAGVGPATFDDLGQGSLVPALGTVLAADAAGTPILVGTCERSAFALGFALADPALDADGQTLLAQTALAATLDAAPSATLADAAVDEGSAVALDATGSADGDRTPVAWTWDLDGDGQYDDATGPTAAFDAAALDGPTTSGIGLRITDACGVASTATATAMVSNVAPTPTQASLQSAASVGQPATFSAASTDPAGAADPRTWAWDWGDASADTTADGAAVGHTWAEPGTFAATAVVDDGDGGTAVLPFTVVVGNPGPSASGIAGPVAVDEGSLAAFEASGADANGDPLIPTWAWGDGTPDTTGSPAEHTWADDGSYSVVATVTDPWGALGTAAIAVDGANVAPTLSASPAVVATEGAPYAVAPGATDPGGAADPLTFSLAVRPAAATVDPATGAVAWTPGWADAVAGSAAFELVVTDDEGASDSVAWTVAVAYADVDGDGLPDTWEALYGLDPAADDAADDPDGDGLDNAAEWAGGTDPQTSNAPDAPVPLAPLAGATVDTAPVLQASPARDPDGDPLTYAFEVWDAGANALLADTAGVADPLAGWTVSPALPDNAPAQWRVRADDGSGPGPWSAFVPVVVDAANQPPAAPALLAPTGTVDAAAPELITGPAVDPEGDAVTVIARLYDDSSLLGFVELSPTPDGFAGVSPVALPEDVDLSWTAEAIDAHGASAGESDPTYFRVDPTNAAPPAPAWLAPDDGATVGAAPELRVSVDPDPEDDAVVVQFEIDATASFASASIQALQADVEFGEAAVTPAPLPENAVAWLRARAVDEFAAASPWIVRSVFVDAAPQPPTQPRLLEPADGATLDGAFEARWSAATDPEGDAVTYRLWVWDEAGEAIVDAEGLTATSLALEALDPGAWTLAVQADDGDQAGPTSPIHRVVVLAEAGEPVDLDEGTGGCAHAPGVTVLALLPWLLRRRR